MTAARVEEPPTSPQRAVQQLPQSDYIAYGAGAAPITEAML